MGNRSAILTKEVLDEVQRNGLRTNGIVWGASMEEFLQRLIESKLEPDAMELINRFHLCGDFRKKAVFCYSMGFISKEFYQDIDNLRKIRNICAHNVRLEEANKEEIEKIEEQFINSKKVFIGKEKQSLEVRIFLGFITIMTGLIKKINRAEKIRLCEWEVHDLGFEDIDYEMMKEFVDI